MFNLSCLSVFSHFRTCLTYFYKVNGINSCWAKVEPFDIIAEWMIPTRNDQFETETNRSNYFIQLIEVRKQKTKQTEIAAKDLYISIANKTHILFKKIHLGNYVYQQIVTTQTFIRFEWCFRYIPICIWYMFGFC